eukprot:m.23025 g.23025  ORF g.23025 m.23025 type:complete len:446 (-) comp4053_c0_seq1:47-1384(-)
MSRYGVLALFVICAVLGSLFLLLDGAISGSNQSNSNSSNGGGARRHDPHAFDQAPPVHPRAVREASNIAAASDGRVQFDFSRDWFVQVHIQKTGGTSFAAKLTRLVVDPPCHPRRRPKVSTAEELAALRNAGTALSNPVLNDAGFEVRGIECPRPGGSNGNWLLARETSGWSCGIHPSLERLEACYAGHGKAGNARLFYVTVLREPVSRFLSEFLMKKGGGWSLWNDGMGPEARRANATIPSDRFCSGGWRHKQRPCAASMPHHVGRNSSSAEVLELLPEFLACRHNPAANRQTRMLASGRPCISPPRSDIDDAQQAAAAEEEAGLLLDLAMRALRKIAFFGILEFPRQTEQLFEWTFGVKFSGGVSPPSYHSRASHVILNATGLAGVRAVNRLDVELFEFAVRLFQDRVRNCGTCDPLSHSDVYELLNLFRAAAPAVPAARPQD